MTGPSGIQDAGIADKVQDADAPTDCILVMVKGLETLVPSLT